MVEVDETFIGREPGEEVKRGITILGKALSFESAMTLADIIDPSWRVCEV